MPWRNTFLRSNWWRPLVCSRQWNKQPNWSHLCIWTECVLITYTICLWGSLATNWVLRRANVPFGFNLIIYIHQYPIVLFSALTETRYYVSFYSKPLWLHLIFHRYPPIWIWHVIWKRLGNKIRINRANKNTILGENVYMTRNYVLDGECKFVYVIVNDMNTRIRFIININKKGISSWSQDILSVSGDAMRED